MWPPRGSRMFRPSSLVGIKIVLMFKYLIAARTCCTFVSNGPRNLRWKKSVHTGWHRPTASLWQFKQFWLFHTWRVCKLPPSRVRSSCVREKWPALQKVCVTGVLNPVRSFINLSPWQHFTADFPTIHPCASSIFFPPCTIPVRCTSSLHHTDWEKIATL